MPVVDWGEQQPIRLQAQYTKTCPACDEAIIEGDWIVLDEDDVWIHEGCLAD